MSHLGTLKVDGPEALHSGRVDDCPAAGKVEHLAECGGVHACVMDRRHIAHSQPGTGHEAIDERRLPHSGVAREKRHFALQRQSQRVHALACHRAGGKHGISDAFVQPPHRIEQHAVVIGGEQIHLVDDQQRRHPVGHGGGQKTVDESGVGHRIGQRHHQHGLVEIAGYNLKFLRQVTGTPDDVVATLVDRGNHRGAVGLGLQPHHIAHGHRIGAAKTSKPQIALDFAIHLLAVIGAHHVPAAGVFYDQPFHHGTKLQKKTDSAIKPLSNAMSPHQANMNNANDYTQFCDNLTEKIVKIWLITKKPLLLHRFLERRLFFLKVNYYERRNHW